MAEADSNARKFLDAFNKIEAELARRQDKHIVGRERPKFYELVKGTDDLLQKHKDELYLFGNLRNAIAHNPYRDQAPIADPRDDTVAKIQHIRDLVLRPPRLVDALQAHGRPRIFRPDDDVKQFLRLVTEDDFSQAPVEIDQGRYELITTNAVARWFGHNLDEHGGVLDGASIAKVLEYSEVGDRLQKVGPDTSTAKAINIFSGLASSDSEPPAALLVMGLPGQPPQRLAVRADLVRLYAQLGE